MPADMPFRQPVNSPDWFASPAGQVVLESEMPSFLDALAQRPGLPWLMFSAHPRPTDLSLSSGLWLHPTDTGWHGDVRCSTMLPLASESISCIVLQHIGDPRQATEWLSECQRVLMPGGKLWLFALNPLSPYHRYWLWRDMQHAAEPFRWRRALREVGLNADALAEGLGPTWRMQADPIRRMGAGARAAYLLRAEKTRCPLTLRPQRLLRPALEGRG